MPIIVDSGAGSDRFGLWDEFPVSKTGLQAGGTDTLTHGGSAVWNESPVSNTGLASVESDTLVSPGVRIWNEHPASLTGLSGETFAPSDEVFNETPTSSTGLQSMALGGQKNNEFVFSAVGLFSSLVDTSVIAGGFSTIFENPISATGLLSLCADNCIAYALPRSLTGLRATALTSFLFVDAPRSLTGLLASAIDTQVSSSAPTSRTGLQSMQSGSLETNESPTSQVGLRASLSSPWTVFESPMANTGLKGQTVSHLVTADIPRSQTGLSSVAAEGSHVVSEAPASRTGLQSIAAANTVFANVTASSVGLYSVVSQSKGYLEFPLSRTGTRSSAIDNAIYNDSPTSSTGLRGLDFQPEMSFDALIPAIRLKVDQNFSELTAIAEALPPQEELDNLKLPYFIIAADQPSEVSGWAVNDLPSMVEVDLVLIRPRAAGVDVAQRMRADLQVLRDAIVRDFRMHGPDGIPTALTSNQVATPFDRQTVYQTHFSSRKQPVVVMVLTMSFLQSASRLPAETWSLENTHASLR